MLKSIGKLRHKVNIISRSQTGTGDRGQGEYTDTTLFSNVPASIHTLSGRELETSRQLVSDAKYKITVRYHSGIDETQRIVWGNNIYQIGHISNPEQRNLWLILTCSQVG